MKRNAPTLVLMPGLDGTGLLFERVVAALPTDFRVHVVRYPNDASLSLDEHAAVAVRDIPSGPTVLLAESFSGLVALHLLRERHRPVEKVIFVASLLRSPLYLKVLLPLFGGLFGLQGFIPNGFWRYFCMGAGATGSDIEWLKGVLAQVSPSVVAHRLKLVASAAVKSEAPIDIPTFYIQPDADRLVPRSAPEHFQVVFNRFTLLRVAGPHFLLQTSSVECARLIAGIVLEAPNNKMHQMGGEACCCLLKSVAARR